MEREPVYASLFGRLRDAYAWKTSGRTLKHWSDVPPSQQPAMFQTQVGEQSVIITRQRNKWILDVKVYIYANQPNKNGPPAAQALNILLDAISKAMEPDHAAQEVQTLGGLVEYARIEGNIETDEGFLGEQAVAIVPIRILTAT